jgi:hypothetical protein
LEYKEHPLVRGEKMQMVISFFAGLDKTTVKQFVTVVGVIGFFVLILAVIILVSMSLMEAATNVVGWMIAVAVITGVVGKEYFMSV